MPGRFTDVTSPLVLGKEDRARVERVEELAKKGSVTELVALLTDPSWAVRRSVVDALGALGDAATGALVRVLETQRDDESRLAASVDALVASSGSPEDAVIAMASHADPAVVADAAQILGRRRARAGVPTLVALTRHRDENVAVAAIEALGRIGGRSAVDALVDAVRSRHFFRTFPAIDVLSRTGDPRAIAPLTELLDDSRYHFEATRALGRTGDPLAVEPLAGLLSRTSDALVRMAALALADLQERHRERFGATHAIEDALRSAAPPTAIRNLGRALAGASATEQARISFVLGALGSEDAIAVIAPLLERGPVVARAATEALEKIGREAAARISIALREGDSETRRAVLSALRVRRHALDGVLACLDDPDPAVRAGACETLARAADPNAVPKLFERLRDSDPRVVQVAMGAIQSLGTAETEGLALAAARSRKPSVRLAALRILAYFGYGSALPTFLEALRGDDARLRDAAIQGLRFLEGPEAFEALLATTRAPEARTRAAAMRSLGHGRDDLRVQSYLLRGLTDEDGWVRYYACQSLGRLGLSSAAPAIAGLLHDPAGQVRAAAIEALSHLDSPIARDALLQAARSDDPDVRRAALIGLGIARRPESLPLLADAAKNDDAATRLVAVSALAGFDGREVVELLDRAARDPDESVRVAAVSFLAARTDAASARKLVAMLADRHIEDQALAALSRHSPDRIQAIVEALDTADDELAPKLTSALARMQRPEAERALMDVLSSRSGPAARRAAAETLAGLGRPEVAEVLDRCAARDPDPQVRRVCSVFAERHH